MGKDKTIILKGASECAYVFNVYPWNTLLVCSGVVYVVLLCNRFGYTVLYVGSTDMLSGHMTEHSLLAEFDEAGKTHIGIHIEPSVLIQQVKEKDLIVNYLPLLNVG